MSENEALLPIRFKHLVTSSEADSFSRPQRNRRSNPSTFDRNGRPKCIFDKREWLSSVSAAPPPSISAPPPPFEPHPPPTNGRRRCDGDVPLPVEAKAAINHIGGPRHPISNDIEVTQIAHHHRNQHQQSSLFQFIFFCYNRLGTEFSFFFFKGGDSVGFFL